MIGMLIAVVIFNFIVYKTNKRLLWHAVILGPILLLILLGFYKWICKLERRAGSSYEKQRY